MAPLPATTVDELFSLLASCDGIRDALGPEGDPIDILAHSLQCASSLAETNPADQGLQISGLVHDLGHALAPGCAAEHGAIAASYVEPLLGPRVARLTLLHVPAKRYLVTTQPSYSEALSRGSTLSLEIQGGALTDPERRDLEREPYLDDALALRRADEAAKVVGKSVEPLDHWRPIVKRFVNSGD